MNVTILHGYSASNSGDGLLVDLAIALVQRNFGEDTSINVVASDPQSFAYPPHPRFDAPVMAAKGLGRVKQAVFLNQSYAGLADLLRKTDLIVGVGGGYMRSKSAFEHIKLKLGHASNWKRRSSARCRRCTCRKASARSMARAARSSITTPARTRCRAR
jgi:polysaccharide pyruvyl transferase WcaK-like protein